MASRTRCVGVGVAAAPRAVGAVVAPAATAGFPAGFAAPAAVAALCAALRSPAAARTSFVASASSGAASSRSKLLECAPIPRPRAAECPPVTQGRVCLTEAAACGVRRGAPHQAKIFTNHWQATRASAARPRPAPRRGVPGSLVVLRDALSLGPLRVRFEFGDGDLPGCWLTCVKASGARLRGLPRAP